jgi:hypothetical protein
MKEGLIPCWKTSDGEIFDSQDEALDHQKKVNRCTTIEEILRHPQTLPKNRTDHDDAVITDFLMGNWDTLTSLFKS